MKHGELIRKLRTDRFITQQKLADGITHRTTLISFEKHSTKIDYETLLQYLNRMNVTVEEYQYLFSEQQLSVKDKDRAILWQLIIRKDLSVSSPEVQEQLQYFLTTFDQTDDFFYYYLYAQLFLITTYHQHRLNLSDPATKSIKIRIQKYLNGIQTWGRFEPVLFINCMFIFDNDFIEATFKSVLKRTNFYMHSQYYTADLKGLIIHGLSLSLERHNPVLFDLIYNELTILHHKTSDTDLLIDVKIFSFVRSSIDHGIDEALRDELFKMLTWLGMDDWINYIETTIASFNLQK